MPTALILVQLEPDRLGLPVSPIEQHFVETRLSVLGSVLVVDSDMERLFPILQVLVRELNVVEAELEEYGWQGR
jgi:hypothetical protein